MKKIIVIILTLLIIAFSGCTENICSPTVWRNGILEAVKVGDITSITIRYSRSNKSFSYIFKERLDILNELTIGEYYEFGIYSKVYGMESSNVYKLVEIYDSNETLIWTCL